MNAPDTDSKPAIHAVLMDPDMTDNLRWSVLFAANEAVILLCNVTLVESNVAVVLHSGE